MSGSAIVLAFQLVYILGWVIAVVYLVIMMRPSLWLTMVFGIIAGIYMEMANDLLLVESIVWYPQPHILPLPGSRIPLPIVLGWGAYAVITRLICDRFHGALIKTHSPVLRALAFVALLCGLSFAIGFAIEFVATLMGGWVYRDVSGWLLFPLWSSGPTVWLVVIPLVTAIAEMLTFVIQIIAPGFRLRANGMRQ